MGKGDSGVFIVSQDDDDFLEKWAGVFNHDET